jgi:hypothetical protein
MNDLESLRVRRTGRKDVSTPFSIFVSILIDLEPFTIGSVELGAISVARRHKKCDRTRVPNWPLW